MCLECCHQELKDYMKQAGEVMFADAHKNRPNEGLVFEDASLGLGVKLLRAPPVSASSKTHL